MAHPILSGTAGDIELLLGNEAIVRGAVEAGIEVVTCYPGTPSSEAPDTFFRLSPDGKYYFEYSVNEKVALEVGGGAALAGSMTLTTMKHVGVNVAADPLMTLAYVGVPGGLVLLSADDPGCHSSQNEQDNRLYARLAGMPVFEPSTAQEAKDMARDALTLSRVWQQPVLLRTTTRVNHMRGPVTFGDVREPASAGEPVKNPRRFVPVPAVARVRHVELLKKLDEIKAEMEGCRYNEITGKGGVGVVASGISRAYVKDAQDELGLHDALQVLSLGFTYPLPEKLCLEFMSSLKRLVVVEEGEPVLENELRALAQKHGLGVEILGKGFAGLTRLGEYDTRLLAGVLAQAAGVGKPTAHACAASQELLAGLPQRPPNLCSGCPHRASYFAVRQVFGNDAFYSSDIGCYTLGILPPLAAADFLLCMGSSISAGSGFAKASGKPVVAFIGDSTFFHSGITGIVNAVFNRHDLLVVVLDNHTTAMTGHQPNPGVEVHSLGANEAQVDVEAVVRGCGVTEVRTVSPTNLKAMREALEELKAVSGVRVLVAKEPCPLHARRLLGKKFAQVAYIPETTESVRACLDELACPSFKVEADGSVAVDESTCTGCMVCLQVSKDIKARKRGSK
ncbi:indolepyruvate ferredoxin oxidoreductase, alpha subunit [Desulfovibrio sp. X2]|uniref:indolepyruvate ferredoxin oxidoreductase subunit alpha n=1 Tax=Desulfovibrio sp. X2 TaxID=941449 RepID=UPI000358D176|nr:indolepyruvate ferredoxin oxidoreductase subunit alpha [Desulfovibrio sp. X2]EPR42791.1 indolepyruvate ferredoxin oxidoreductase, alpha subunit [Desulfovibrio sp. X2]